MAGTNHPPFEDFSRAYVATLDKKKQTSDQLFNNSDLGGPTNFHASYSASKLAEQQAAEAKRKRQELADQLQAQADKVKSDTAWVNNPIVQAASHATDFINSNKKVALPEIPGVSQQFAKDHPVVAGAANVARLVPNLGISLANTEIGQGIIDPTLDTGRIIGKAISGQELPQYKDLRSSVIKAGYQIGGKINSSSQKGLGIDESANAAISNAAGVALPIAGAYTGGGAAKVGAAGVKSIGEMGAIDALKTIGKGAASGALAGGAFGGLGSLAEDKPNQSTKDKFVQAGINALFGAAAGAVAGAAIPTASYAYGKGRLALADKLGVPADQVVSELYRRGKADLAHFANQAATNEQGFMLIPGDIAKNSSSPALQAALDQAKSSGAVQTNDLPSIVQRSEATLSSIPKEQLLGPDGFVKPEAVQGRVQDIAQQMQFINGQDISAQLEKATKGKNFTSNAQLHEAIRSVLESPKVKAALGEPSYVSQVINHINDGDVTGAQKILDGLSPDNPYRDTINHIVNFADQSGVSGQSMVTKGAYRPGDLPGTTKVSAPLPTEEPISPLGPPPPGSPPPFTGNTGPPGANGVPSILDQLAPVQPNDTVQPMLNRDFVKAKYNDLKVPVLKAADGMSEKDLQLLYQIENPSNLGPKAAAARLERIAKTADNPEQFKAVVAAMRQGYDTRLAGDLTLNRDVARRDNYLPHIFDTTDPTTNATLKDLEQQQARLVSKGLPGYTKPRSFDTIQQALDWTGPNGEKLKLKNANAVEDYLQSMNQAGLNHGSAALEQGLNTAFPGKIAAGKIGFDTNSGTRFDQLKIPGANGLSASQDVATLLNKRASSQPATGALGIYDEANATVKYAKLGGGTFHGFTTALSSLGQQTTSGNLFRHPIENLKIIAGSLSQNAHDQNLAQFAADGTLDNARRAGVTLMDKEILGDVNPGILDKLKSGNPVSKYLINPIHDMVFQRQIPEVKLTIFRQATKGLDASVPADLVKMRAAAAAVNNLGGINRAVTGLTPQQAKVVSRFALATDFTEGKFRTLFAALTKRGPEGTIARQLVVGKTLVAAIPGVATLAATGALKTTEDWQKAITDQIVDPSVPLPWRGSPTKTNPKGTPQAAHLPATFISELTRVIKPALDPLAPDKTQGVTDYAKGRLAALPALGVALGSNSDYFGNPIYGNDALGNPIGAGKTALNIANQVSPIPAVQAGKAAFEGQNIAASALNTAGFKVKNDTASVEGQKNQRVSDFYNTRNMVSDTRSNVSKKVTDLIVQGKINEAKRTANDFNAKLPDLLKNFRDKYQSDYNPEWDKEFKSLVIPTTDKAFSIRRKSAAESAKLLK